MYYPRFSASVPSARLFTALPFVSTLFVAVAVCLAVLTCATASASPSPSLTSAPILYAKGPDETGKSAGSSVFAPDVVSINTANAAALAATLDGVGPVKAKAIVKWREKNGGFKSLEDLTRVKGIGEATLVKNREKITL